MRVRNDKAAGRRYHGVVLGGIFNDPFGAHRQVEEYMSDASLSESGDGLSLEDRIKSLEEKHSELDSALKEEEARPLPDSLTIATLKRQKLAIKDELADLTHH